MKKASKIVLAVTLLAILSITLVACNLTLITSVPPVEEVKANLESAGYSVEIQTFPNGYTRSKLEARKGEDYIIIYWVTDSSYCDWVEKDIKYRGHNGITTIESDFGDSKVIAGTDQAIKDAKLGTFSLSFDK